MAFYIVLANVDNRQIAEVHFPNDWQIVDNVESAQLICNVLKSVYVSRYSYFL